MISIVTPIITGPIIIGTVIVWTVLGGWSGMAIQPEKASEAPASKTKAAERHGLIPRIRGLIDAEGGQRGNRDGFPCARIVPGCNGNDRRQAGHYRNYRFSVFTHVVP